MSAMMHNKNKMKNKEHVSGGSNPSQFGHNSTRTQMTTQTGIGGFETVPQLAWLILGLDFR